MAYKICVTRPARQAAQDCAACIRDNRRSPAAARSWLDGLFGAIQKRAEYPDRFSVIPEADELGFPYRSFVYHSQRVVFALHEAEELVIVHRVYHGARKPLTMRDVR